MDQCLTRREAVRGGVVLAGTFLSGCAGVLSSSSGGTRNTWYNARGDAQATGYQPAASGPESAPTEVWRIDRIAESSAPPVVDGDTVYVGDGGSVVAVDSATGDELWTALEDVDGHHGRLAANGDALFVESDTDLVALSMTDGEELWRVSESVARFNRPVATEDRVFVSEGYEVHCIDADTGEVRWRALDGRTRHDLTVGSDGWVYLIDDESVVHGVTPAGDVEWTYELGDGSFERLTYGGGRIYCANFENERTFALDPRTGSVEWEIDLPASGAPAYDGDAVYVVGRRSGATKLDPDTGEIDSAWSSTSVSEAAGEPVVTTDTLLLWASLPDDEEALVGLATDTARERWRGNAVSEDRSGSLALGADRLYRAREDAIVAYGL